VPLAATILQGAAFNVSLRTGLGRAVNDLLIFDGRAWWNMKNHELQLPRVIMQDFQRP
jgi:hypothetical protein